MTGNTNTLATNAAIKMMYGFTSVCNPIGIPTLASPSGEILHIIVIRMSFITILF